MSDPVNIKEALDHAETWDGSGIINWGEVPMSVLVQFAKSSDMMDYDVESVQEVMLERWGMVS